MFSRSKQLAINLLPQDPFFESGIGRVLQWSMGAGRYIVIFTEIVVILSFAARFTLDRQVTDLNEKLYGQIHQLEGLSQDEEGFRMAQAQLAEVKKSQDVSNILDVFVSLNAVVPNDVTINQLSISQNAISLESKALTQTGFITFINNLQLSKQFSTIRIGKVESSGSGDATFTFSLTAATRNAPVVTVQKTPQKIEADAPAELQAN
ncbi:PilN domain-containing protein [Candidatus Woesebacteria bacterium]|nr:PilN domain-containing protein [Candidatus Woesebacteria bacterium]